jgi:hypothetical protein
VLCRYEEQIESLGQQIQAVTQRTEEAQTACSEARSTAAAEAQRVASPVPAAKQAQQRDFVSMYTELQRR